jgi:hypothetical protein
MNIRSYPTLGLIALLAVGSGKQAAAGIFSNNINMLVVAEQPRGVPPSSGPVSYIAFDGGYIEAGDFIAGDTPPTPEQVSQSLHAILADQGFRIAQGSPSVVLTYYWGVLRIDHMQIRQAYAIRPNFEARIDMVSTKLLGDEVKNHILSAKKSGELNSDASAPRILVGPLKTIMENSRQPRYFVVVSAYDYEGLVHLEAKLLWRVKLSAQENNGGMDDVIPALIAGGGPYFGKNLPNVQELKVSPLTRTTRPVVETTSFLPSPEAYQLDKQFVDGLLKAERGKISGIVSGILPDNSGG